VLGGDVDALRLATLIQATVPGAPAVYYGDEIGMTGSIDPHARAAFPWSRRDTWDESIRGFMRDAFRLRHAEPVLRHGSFRVVGAQGSVVAWLRVFGDRVALVACNNGAEADSIRIDAPELRGRPLVPAALPGRAMASIPSVPSDGLELVVPPRTGVVLLG
jgi:cyclomaltodextrinase